jgi:hypothetical protein
VKKLSILAQIWKIFIFAKTLKIINFGQILKNHHKKSSIHAKIWKNHHFLHKFEKLSIL